MIRTMNDSTQAEPYLRKDLCLITLLELPAWSRGPRVTAESLGDTPQRLRGLGYVGVQCMDPGPVLAAGLKATGLSRIRSACDAMPIVGKARDDGFEALVVHVGTGLDTDAQMDQLIDGVLSAAVRYDFPVYVETHRSTVTQDIRRTLELIRRFPEIRFNADLSHWYTGHEMNADNFSAYLSALEPVFERTRFMHGRIGNSGCIQVDFRADDRFEWVDHHRELWTRCFMGFLRHAGPGDFLSFNPELLPSTVHLPRGRVSFNYAREFRQADGTLVEEGDRWNAAQIYWDIATQCFAEAKQRLAANRAVG